MRWRHQRNTASFGFNSGQRVERVQAVVAVLTHADACLELFGRCLQSGDLVAWNSLADEVDAVLQTRMGETVAWCKSELLQLMTADEKRAAIDQGTL